MALELLQVGATNRTVKAFVHLNRSRSFREKQQQFAMEGYRLVLDALESGICCEALLLTPHANEQYGKTLRAVAPDVRMLEISEPLAAEIADTESAQGVFAIAKQVREMDTLPATQSRCLLLHCLQDPSNLGAILRTAEALGIDGVYLYQCCDLYNPKTIRASMGALFRIPLSRLKSMDAIWEHCAPIALPTCAAVIERDAMPLQAFDFTQGAVALIGNEGNGLPQDVIAHCSHRLTIPMSAASNSLNAAMAAGIFLWEMNRTTER